MAGNKNSGRYKNGVLRKKAVPQVPAMKKEMMIEKVEPITAFPKQGGFQFLQQEIKIALASSKKDIG